VLLGRQREIAHIDRLIDAARAGASAALVLHGPAGIGKSSLIAEAVRHAEEQGFLVLRTRGFESESEIPFGGLLELLTPLLHLRDRLAEPQARALGSALALEPPSPFDRFAVPAGMLSVLDAAATDQPVLACVDDVHWLDGASLEALAFVARRLGAEGVVLLLGTRPMDDVVGALAGVQTLEIPALEHDAARELLEQASPHALADHVADGLLSTAGGNPLALVEMPRALSRAQLAGREPLSGPLPAGETIQRAFVRQLEALPPETQFALLLASAMETGRPDHFHAAREYLGLPVDVLGAAEDGGLVTVGASIEFSHPLLRSAAYHASRAEDRRRAHRALADVVDPARRAWHLATAAVEPDEQVAASLEAAGHEARLRGGQLAAGQAFERAAQLSVDPTAKARRLLEAATDLAGAGRPDHAMGLVDAAAALRPEGDLATQTVRVRGRLEMLRGAPLLAHDLVMAEAERVKATRPVTAASLMVEAAVAHMMTGDMEALVTSGNRARELLDGSDPVLEALAGVLVGEAHAALGNEEQADALIDPVLPLLTGGHVLSMPAEIVGMAGMCAIWYERWDRATAVLDRLISAARDASAVTSLIYPLSAHALLDFRRGRWQSAYADAAESVRLARETGNHALLAFGLAALSLIEAAMGRSDDARAHARESLDLCAQLGGLIIKSYAHHALGLDALGSGDSARAAEHLDRAQRTGAPLRMQRGLVQFGADRVEALHRAGRTDEAHLALEELADGSSGGRWALAAIARCRGILAESGYEDHFENALGHHQRDGQPFERGRTQLAYGERLRRDRRRADAREQLIEALEIFERLGAARWTERVRAELRVTGGTSPSANPGPLAKEAVAAAGLDELTAHELQIARLVAYGLTNREVAAKLFLSPKTIEYHLSQIYRKLDLRSRTQLASLMTAELSAA
jgi:ATP/maltotriose-dependent transcriptional regulator MalT